MKTLTPRTLKSSGACSEQVALFRKLFGEQVEVTPASCLQYASRFDWSWASCHLLDDRQRKAYDEAVALASKAYDEATAPARKAYDEALAPARKAYDEALAPARKAYDEAPALAFANAFNS